jgi:hypothetical protein
LGYETSILAVEVEMAAYHLDHDDSRLQSFPGIRAGDFVYFPIQATMV